MPAQRCHSVSKLISQAEVSLNDSSLQKQEKQLVQYTSQPLLVQKNEKNGTSDPPKDGVKKKTKTRTVKKKKKKTVLSANLSMTKYNLVRQVCSDFGFTFSGATTSDCFLIWSDCAVPAEKIAELKSYQKINHFVGMGEICRKDSLARNIWRVQRVCPNDFNFVPQTWILPGEYSMFQFQARESKKKKKRSKTYIRKPVNGAMGNGIWLTRNAEKILPNESCIIQEYLDKPMLMDGFKFDLRMYVFVMSCDPLKIFLYKDGLVRMGTEPYTSPSESNITSSFMHLTNYSINKHSENFIQTSKEDLGSKRTLKYFWKWLEDKGENVEAMRNRVADAIIKTILVAEPRLFHAYHMCRGSDPQGESCCFEILGFDIFIDRKCKPWVLEVNRAPSFGADQDLDYEIKYGVLSSVLNLLNIKTKDKKRRLKAEKVESNKRLMGATPRKTVEPSNLAGNKRKLLQKRKKDLKWRLHQLRTEAQKKQYEDKNAGEFVRIYPPATKPLCDYYSNLLEQCTKVITGRTTLQKNESHLCNLKEEEILDLLQEVENDVLHLVNNKGQYVLKGPVPLLSMPSAQRPIKTKSVTERITIRPASYSSNPQSLVSRTSRPSTALLKNSSQQESKTLSIEDEEKVTETLQLLQCMKIKYPGKSDEEAEQILEQIQDNWKLHRARVAAYWLVKLDAVKRKKVIDIVRGNVTVIMQRAWKTQDVESIPLQRSFTKLFHRLLWSHGQGLWNCFNANGDTWESIFSKSAEQLTQVEIQCCRQIVKLCRDCLLVVYQFASESQICSSSSSSSVEVNTENPSNKVASSRSFYTRDRRIQTQLSNGHLMGTKITRLYK